MTSRIVAAMVFAAGFLALLPASAAHAEEPVPRYDHIFVIVEENHTASQISGNPRAPIFNLLARTYGEAAAFYAERHPSEPNYIAMLGGDTFGIDDDDAYYCTPMSNAKGCSNAHAPGYVNHTIDTKSFPEQVADQGLTWRGYFEDIPEPGSPVYWSPLTRDKPEALYASKHNAFMNFKHIWGRHKPAEMLFGFDALDADIARHTLPNFAVIVPNQCNDMHGMMGLNVPVDCFFLSFGGLVSRADRQIGELVTKITSSREWNSSANFAIVITFDENDTGNSGGRPAGCCGSGPGDPHNPGGGWIATIVITNHGPRGVKDCTPYNHYSLLRTMEQAFGIKDYLGHAADADKGVVAMSPLFQIGGTQTINCKPR